MEAFKYYSQNLINDSILSLLLENSIITVVDSLGRVEFASDRFCRILECELDCFVGEVLDDIFTNFRSGELPGALWATVRSGRIWKGVLRGKSTNENSFWLDTTIIPIKDEIDNNEKYALISNDVTKVYSENTNYFQNSLLKDKYSLIFQSIKASIVVSDSEGNITDWNRGAEQTFGYSKIEILGKKLSTLISKNNRIKNIEELLQVKNSKTNHFNGSPQLIFCLNKKGEEFPVEFVQNSFELNGNLFHCAIMLNVSKRNTDSNNSNFNSENSKPFLAAQNRNISSSYGSNKNPIVSFNKIKANVKNDALISKGIVNRGKLLSFDFTDGVNPLSKFESLGASDFQRIIDNVLRILSNSKNFEDIQFSITIDNTLNFNTDPDLIYSILQNLIHNAVKYSNPLTEAHCPCIEISVKSIKNNIEIKLMDNGQGIAEHCIDKIFNLYYRANVKDTPGNGLGLYVVKSIVEDLRGEIEVESAINVGTHFKILLPDFILKQKIL